MVGAWKTDQSLKVRLAAAAGLAIDFPLADIALPGEHNLENLMAALLLALEMGATPAGCAEILANFRGLPHRLEWVANLAGIDFFDDSKATNVDAVVRSLEHFDRPVVLIAGGRDKGGDYSPLFPWLRRKVKQDYFIGRIQGNHGGRFYRLRPSPNRRRYGSCRVLGLCCRRSRRCRSLVACLFQL